MSRKPYLEQACQTVPEFKIISEKFLRKYTIAGKSDSCTRNYPMQIAKLVLHFKCSPLNLSADQLEEYLFYIRGHEAPCLSSFKHLVYGLRTMFSMFKNEKLLLSLPSIAGSKALPEVFSRQEIKRIIKTPKLLKHRVLFAIIREEIRHAFRVVIRKTGIKKNVCIHTLRHSYATHLLEMGLDIVSVKNQLGHADICTTMMYLHIAKSDPLAGFSPMEKLYSHLTYIIHKSLLFGTNKLKIVSIQ